MKTKIVLFLILQITLINIAKGNEFIIMYKLGSFNIIFQKMLIISNDSISDKDTSFIHVPLRKLYLADKVQVNDSIFFALKNFIIKNNTFKTVKTEPSYEVLQYHIIIQKNEEYQLHYYIVGQNEVESYFKKLKSEFEKYNLTCPAIDNW